MSDPSWFTVGEIARKNGVPTHRVQYAILSLGIKPTGRAGVLRMFDADAVARISAALNKGNKTNGQ